MSIKFKLTRDPGLLAQYYALREQCFREELDLPDFDGSEEVQDRQGQILVAIKDGRCLGGVRISPTVPLQSQVQKLEFKPETCCMWERLVLAPAARTVEFFRDFCANIIEFSRAAGYHHALILSSLRNARLYRRCHSALGIGFVIHRHVPHSAQGAFAGLEHYLSVAHLQDMQPLRVAANPLLALRPAASG
jgi:hypothetical protein